MKFMQWLCSWIVSFACFGIMIFRPFNQIGIFTLYIPLFKIILIYITFNSYLTNFHVWFYRSPFLILTIEQTQFPIWRDSSRIPNQDVDLCWLKGITLFRMYCLILTPRHLFAWKSWLTVVCTTYFWAIHSIYFYTK